MHKKIHLGKSLASVCSVSVDDVPDGLSGIFLAHFPDFRRFNKGHRECAQKLDDVAAVIFTLIDIIGEFEMKQ